ncbi:MAG: hypothetical protein AAFU41_00845 [Pseudomonadota bacterium]
MVQFPPQVSFNSGEVSPLLLGRTDYKRVRTGVRQMRGYMPLRQGGFTRAPGTIFRGFVDGNKPARLIPFEFNRKDALILEFTGLSMRVWRYGSLIMSGASPYALATPFAEADLPNLTDVQSSDRIYFATGAGPLQRLSRMDLDDWQIEDWQLNAGPFRVQNLDEAITIQCSGEAGSITLTGVGSPFEADHVGSLFLIEPTDISDIALWTGNTSASSGDLFRYDSRIYELTSGNNTGVEPPVHFEGEQLYSKSTNTKWRFISDMKGVARIDAVTNANSATATVLKPIPKPCVSSATYRWSEGAWSPKYGYPKAIEIIKQRFAAAATPSEPRAIWFSTQGAYDDFEPSVEPDGSFAYTIDGSGSQNGINWLRRGRKGLYIGTLGEVLRGFSSQAGQAIGPTTFDTDVEGTNGSINAKPIVPNGFPIYITKDETRLEELRYSFEVDGGLPLDLTLPAEQITALGVEEIVWQPSPLRHAWLRRSDGNLVMMLYDVTEEVLGWAEIPLAGGFVESLAVSSSSDGKVDILTMVVRRAVNGATVRMVEEQAITYGALNGTEPIYKANHLFASKVFDLQVETDTFDMSHLVGESVLAWTDNGQFGPLVVPADGQVVLPIPVTHAIIGLFDDTAVCDLTDVQAESRAGDTRGHKKRVETNSGVVLHRTAAGYVRGVERHFSSPDVVHSRQPLTRTTVAEELTQSHSGVTTTEAQTGYADEAFLRFEPFGAAPMTVLAAIPAVDSEGAG